MLRYPTEALWQEIAFLAYHLHWPMDELLDLEHLDRIAEHLGIRPGRAGSLRLAPAGPVATPRHPRAEFRSRPR